MRKREPLVMDGEKEALRKSKTSLGLFYIALLCVLIAIESASYFQHYEHPMASTFFTVTALPVFLILIAANLCSIISRARWSFALQALIFLSQSGMAIVDSVDDFWGWGFAIIAIALIVKYELFATHPFAKTLCLIAYYLGICGFSARNGMAHMLMYLLSFLFLLGFFFIVYRQTFMAIATNRMQVYKQKLQLLHLEAQVEEKQEELQTTITRLQKVLAEKEALSATLEASIKSGNSSLDGERKQTDNDRKHLHLTLERLRKQQNTTDEEARTLHRLEKQIRRDVELLPDLFSLSPAERETTVVFYLHRGNLTNMELGALLGVSESVIKNRFRNVFTLLQIHSRTELLAYLDDSLELLGRS